MSVLTKECSARFLKLASELYDLEEDGLIAIEELERQNKILLEALTQLVALKDYKDKCGKDHSYQENQPKVWKQARAAIKQVKG